MTNFTVFEVCTVHDCGKCLNGAKATCGHCGTSNTVTVNSFQRGKTDKDQGLIERHVKNKFEKIGWKIGKTASQNRCPKCFAGIKMAAIRKHQTKSENQPMQSKIVSLNGGEPPRQMSKEDGRIIFEKINEVYLDPTKGYSDNWSDQHIAEDLGVPRVWVSNLREQFFGPDISEDKIKMVADAKLLLSEIAAIEAKAEPLIQQLKALMDRADAIERLLRR